MGADAWITLVVVLVTMAILATERLPAWLVITGAVVVLTAANVIDEDQAFAGLANSAPITVGALYVLAGAAEATGAMEGVTLRALGKGGGSEQRAMARMLFPTAGLSAFIANTPLISILAPRVVSWCRRSDRSAARFLMPLSYAAVLGGVITIMGTSTNLTITGLMEKDGLQPFKLFQITPVGLPIAVIGTLVLVLVAPRLLPKRTTPLEAAGTKVREYTVEVIVQEDGPLVTQTIEAAGLRHLSGVFLVEIERRGSVITPVAPEEPLEGGDRLVFAGDLSRLMDLQRTEGLVLADERHFGELADDLTKQLLEVVVAPTSSLVGRTLPELDFREAYGAAVVAVHRAGERLNQKPGEVRFRPGDVLLVLAPAGFRRRWEEDHTEFTMIAGAPVPPPQRRQRARLVEFLTVAMIASVAFGLFTLLEASVLVAMILLVTRCITPGEARRSVHVEILVIMAMSIALGTAVASSGLAAEVAERMVNFTEGWGSVGILAGILITTMIVTELLSNNAAAALMYPIAVATAAAAGLSATPFILAVLVGASCSFITPIGYQTNTMVYGMGGYKFGDFARVGVPLTITCALVALVTIPIFFPF